MYPLGDPSLHYSQGRLPLSACEAGGEREREGGRERGREGEGGREGEREREEEGEKGGGRQRERGREPRGTPPKGVWE